MQITACKDTKICIISYEKANLILIKNSISFRNRVFYTKIGIYQLAFLTPGIKPWLAISRKVTREIPN